MKTRLAIALLLALAMSACTRQSDGQSEQAGQPQAAPVQEQASDMPRQVTPQAPDPQVFQVQVALSDAAAKRLQGAETVVVAA